ncbi:hypothetical protein QP162_20590 [Sphingomonas aurantiaca]|uniref:hypothetical protein n=1 Tax=Sphingomonas aurantiaca TaxID=185949 RepID=UPI002FE3F763
MRNLKLWRASLGAIARTPDGLEPVLVDMDKYRVPVDAPADDRAVDLAAVVLLDWGEDFAISPLPGAEAVGALVANTFRGQLVVPMGRQAAHWRQCLDLFGAAGVYRIVRPRALDQARPGVDPYRTPVPHADAMTPLSRAYGACRSAAVPGVA